MTTSRDSESQLLDVMVDVAPGTVVYRMKGQWFWRAKPGVTKDAVIEELKFQIQRANLKTDLLQEALESLLNGS